MTKDTIKIKQARSAFDKWAAEHLTDGGSGLALRIWLAAYEAALSAEQQEEAQPAKSIGQPTPLPWRVVQSAKGHEIIGANNATVAKLTALDLPNAHLIVERVNAAPSAAVQPQEQPKPELTVWYGAMPESNGKSNFTAILIRKNGDKWDNMTDGVTIDRSEYPDRVRYEADRVRYLIGELAARPFILDYDADKHSGYAAPVETVQPASKPILTDDEIKELIDGIEFSRMVTADDLFYMIARAVEERLTRCATSTQPASKPEVASLVERMNVAKTGDWDYAELADIATEAIALLTRCATSKEASALQELATLGQEIGIGYEASDAAQDEVAKYQAWLHSTNNEKPKAFDAWMARAAQAAQPCRDIQDGASYAEQKNWAVTDDWVNGWNDCRRALRTQQATAPEAGKEGGQMQDIWKIAAQFTEPTNAGWLFADGQKLKAFVNAVLATPAASVPVQAVTLTDARDADRYRKLRLYPVTSPDLSIFVSKGMELDGLLDKAIDVEMTLPAERLLAGSAKGEAE